MQFIRKHWNGEFSLGRSFWLHLFALGFALRWFYEWLLNAPLEISPILGAQIGIGIYAAMVLLIYPWQIVGTWRSAEKHRAAQAGSAAAAVVQILIVFGLLATIGSVVRFWPDTEQTLLIALGKDPFGPYTVTASQDSQLLLVNGAMSFGISDQAKAVLAENPAISGIVLTSHGGRIREGHALADLIRSRDLTTYAFGRCTSACVVAFVAGEDRFLISGSVIGFHQYTADFDGAQYGYGGVDDLMAADRGYYAERNIDNAFLDRIFQASAEEMWYPTIEELLAANVIHGKVSKTTAGLHEIELHTPLIEEAFHRLPFYKDLAEYAPEEFAQLMQAVDAKAGAGVTQSELEVVAAEELAVIAQPMFKLTSNSAMLNFVRESVKTLELFAHDNPAACAAWLFPDAYGGVNVLGRLSMTQQTAMLNAMGRIVIDAKTKPGAEIDAAAAEHNLEVITLLLQDQLEAMDPAKLTTNADYSAVCDTSISFYSYFLDLEEATAGNALRNLYQQP